VSNVFDSLDALHHALVFGAGACLGHLRAVLQGRADRSLSRAMGVFGRHAWALGTYVLFVGALLWRPAHCTFATSPLLFVAIASTALWLAVKLLRNPERRD
jgi:hypothetical protein